MKLVWKLPHPKPTNDTQKRHTKIYQFIPGHTSSDQFIPGHTRSYQVIPGEALLASGYSLPAGGL